MSFVFLFCFLLQNQDFSGKVTNFGVFWNFTDVRFATFSVLTDASFGENEISTDVRFWAFFWGQNGTRGEKKKLTPLAEFGGPLNPPKTPKFPPLGPAKSQNVGSRAMYSLKPRDPSVSLRTVRNAATSIGILPMT